MGGRSGSEAKAEETTGLLLFSWCCSSRVSSGTEPRFDDSIFYFLLIDLFLTFPTKFHSVWRIVTDCFQIRDQWFKERSNLNQKNNYKAKSTKPKENKPKFLFLSQVLEVGWLGWKNSSLRTPKPEVSPGSITNQALGSGLRAFLYSNQTRFNLGFIYFYLIKW